MSSSRHQRLREPDPFQGCNFNQKDVTKRIPSLRRLSALCTNPSGRFLKANHSLNRTNNFTLIVWLALAGVVCGMVFAYNISIARKLRALISHKPRNGEREARLQAPVQTFANPAMRLQQRKQRETKRSARMVVRRSRRTIGSRAEQAPLARITATFSSNTGNNVGKRYSIPAAKLGTPGVSTETTLEIRATDRFSDSRGTARSRSPQNSKKFHRKNSPLALQELPANLQDHHNSGWEQRLDVPKHVKNRPPHKAMDNLLSKPSDEDEEPKVTEGNLGKESFEYGTERWNMYRNLEPLKGVAGIVQREEGKNGLPIPIQEQCRGSLRAEECYKDVIELAGKYQENGTVTIVVATKGSHDVVVNWCVSMQRLSLHNYFLVALDRETYRFFSERKAPVVELYGMKRRGKISKSEVWVERTYVIYAILRAGINVLVSDADAVMIKSPFQNPASLFEDVSYDIVSSPSNFPSPMKVDELPPACPRANGGNMEWRHQPCMGWILFRSTHRMMEFFTNILLPDVTEYKDDQIGLNCAIRKAGAVWNDGWYWTMRRTMTTISEKPKLKIAVLPGAYYVRNCTEHKKDRERGYGIYNFNAKEVEMYHCKGYRKQANARNNGFWFIQKDWNRTRTPGAAFQSYLESVSA